MTKLGYIIFIIVFVIIMTIVQIIAFDRILNAGTILLSFAAGILTAIIIYIVKLLNNKVT